MNQQWISLDLTFHSDTIWYKRYFRSLFPIHLKFYFRAFFVWESSHDEKDEFFWLVVIEIIWEIILPLVTNSLDIFIKHQAFHDFDLKYDNIYNKICDRVEYLISHVHIKTFYILVIVFDFIFNLIQELKLKSIFWNLILKCNWETWSIFLWIWNQVFWIFFKAIESAAARG